LVQAQPRTDPKCWGRRPWPVRPQPPEDPSATKTGGHQLAHFVDRAITGVIADDTSTGPHPGDDATVSLVERSTGRFGVLIDLPRAHPSVARIRLRRRSSGRPKAAIDPSHRSLTATMGS